MDGGMLEHILWNHCSRSRSEPITPGLFQSTLGYIALLIATLHGLLFGWKQAFELESYRFYLPPSFVVSLALPICVVLGKVLMLLPCLAYKLHQIRKGLDSNLQKCQRLEPVGSATNVSPERVTIM